jgi:hypothetical protein
VIQLRVNVREIIIESCVQTNPGRLGSKAAHCIDVLLASGLIHLAPFNTLWRVLAGLGDGSRCTQCWDSKEVETHLDNDCWFVEAEQRVQRSDGLYLQMHAASFIDACHLTRQI